jgi:hypothetical protein
MLDADEVPYFVRLRVEGWGERVGPGTSKGRSPAGSETVPGFAFPSFIFDPAVYRRGSSMRNRDGRISSPLRGS